MSARRHDIIFGMAWDGSVELESEVGTWLQALSPEEFATVETYIDLLAERGPLLDEPFTRQLEGKLRELRFRLSGRPWRITYFLPAGPGRRVVLLTVFVKSQRQERREIERGVRAMKTCIAEGHVVEEEP